jgi:RNA polymerase sigma-70 factor (ECF subfamily)
MTPEQFSSLSLLERVRASDAGAWDRLVTLYGPLVRRWCQRWGARWEDAEEVAQEVFLAISGSLDQFRRQGTGSFRAWVRGITRYKLLEHFRRQQGRPIAPGGSEALQRLQDVPDPGEPEEDAEEVSRLYHRALDLIRSEFEERSWQAFWLTAVEGRDTAVVAAELGMSTTAVRVAKCRVLGRLRAEAGELID